MLTHLVQRNLSVLKCLKPKVSIRYLCSCRARELANRSVVWPHVIKLIEICELNKYGFFFGLRCSKGIDGIMFHHTIRE